MERTTLIVATDLHYIARELTDHGSYFQRVIEHVDGKVMQYSEELTEAFFAQVNAAYFAGSMGKIDPDTALFECWQQEGAFFSAYLSSIQQETRKDHQTFDFANASPK